MSIRYSLQAQTRCSQPGDRQGLKWQRLPRPQGKGICGGFIHKSTFASIRMLEINPVREPNKPLRTTDTLQQKLGTNPSRDGSRSAWDARAADGHDPGRTETTSASSSAGCLRNTTDPTWCFHTDTLLARDAVKNPASSTAFSVKSAIRRRSDYYQYSVQVLFMKAWDNVGKYRCHITAFGPFHKCPRTRLPPFNLHGQEVVALGLCPLLWSPALGRTAHVGTVWGLKCLFSYSVNVDNPCCNKELRNLCPSLPFGSSCLELMAAVPISPCSKRPRYKISTVSQRALPGLKINSLQSSNL